MKLSELVSETRSTCCDPCAEAVQERSSAKRGQPPYDRPVSRRLVLVENEEGLAEYMFLHADGHLGAVTDDC